MRVDAGSDAGFDARGDAAVDTGVDGGADAAIDAGADVPIDASPDLGVDSAMTVVSAYAFHQFVLVGGAVDVGGLGEILGVVQEDAAPVVRLEGSTARCVASGVGCVRARFRNDPLETEIQTKCIVCIDEVGSCAGVTQGSLNLEAHLQQQPRGEANYLAQGEQHFYGVCRPGGKWRLAQSTVPLPPLMFRLIDTYFDGSAPYSLSKKEIELLRTTPVRGVSGAANPAHPPFLAPLAGGRPIHLALNADGSVSFDDPVCPFLNVVCPSHTDLLAPGDVILLGHGWPEDAEIQTIMNSTAALDAFVAAHNISAWSSTASLSTVEPRRIIVERLLSLEIMRRLVGFFDNRYGIRSKGTSVGYFSFPPARRLITPTCHPSDRPTCERLESELAADEARVLGSLKDRGFDLWTVVDLAHLEDGSPSPVAEQPPHFSNFTGALLNVSRGRPLNPGLELSAVFAASIRAVASELGARPVMVSPAGNGMTFYVDGGFCEAEICRSDFTRYYAVTEVLLRTAIGAFGSARLRAFIFPVLDGGHFDLHNPYETRQGLTTNRVGETGANNPLLNLYLTR